MELQQTEELLQCVRRLNEASLLVSGDKLLQKVRELKTSLEDMQRALQFFSSETETLDRNLYKIYKAIQNETTSVFE